jgi:hypothetical protein
MHEENILEPRGLERMLAFSGDGHYYVCFDYGRLVDTQPTIAFVDVEMFEPVVLVADSCETFVRELWA